LCRNPEKVLLIGLGSGITLGAISTYPEVKELDCAEMERAMVEAAGFFSRENHAVLENPKTRLILNDGRNYVLATEKKYDVIVSEPSNPWMAGVANLFSREFLELCKARLTPDGLMCMWFHTYRMSDRDMKMIIRTFTTVFPNSGTWFAMPADFFLIGWKNPSERPSLAVVKQRLAGNRQADLDLASFHVFDPMALTACYLMGPDELQKFSAGAPLHTDDHPILEFSAPRYMFADTLARNFSELLKARARDPRPFADLTPAVKESAEFHYYSALALEYKDSRTMAAAEAEKAHELAPGWDDASVLWTRLEERRRQAQAKDDTQ
jgi:spermidine synthase